MICLILLAVPILGLSSRLSSAAATTWIVDDDGPADYHTIQEAINAASSGDTILVREGVYVEIVTINKTLKVLGDNKDSVTITKNLTDEFTVLILANNVTFSGFTILGYWWNEYPMTYGSHGIWVGHNFVQITKNRIANHFKGISFGEAAFCNTSYNIFTDNVNGIFLEGESHLVTQNDFYNTTRGTIFGYYVGTHQCSVIGNSFIGPMRYGIWHPSFGGYCRDNIVVGNLFYSCYIGILDDVGALINTTVYHNSFIQNDGHVSVSSIYAPENEWKFDNGYPSGGNYWDGYAAADMYTGPYQNETGIDGLADAMFIVQTFGSGNLTDSYPLIHPYGAIQNLNTNLIYLTIQSAINAPETVDEHTISVHSGIYCEPVTINKTLTLLGEDRETTIIDGEGIFDTLLQVSADNVTVIGITLQDDLPTSGLEGGGIYLIDCNGTSIIGNTITNTQHGINMKNSSLNTLVGNNLESNDVGIQLMGNSSNNAIYHNNFINNSLQTNGTGPPHDSTWDNGCEGNYWSNYNGTDLDGDGIGDTELPCEGVDQYPLVNIYWNPTDINHDLKVDIKDIATAALAFGSEIGDSNWNPHADITGPIPLQPDGKVDIRDIGLIAKNFGKEYS